MKLVRYAAALAALSLALAACGGGSSSTSTSTSSAGGGGGSGKAVDVKLADFSIDLPGGTTLAAGTYTFNVTNAGLICCACIARSDDHFSHTRGLSDLPRKCVFASAGADDEDFHAG